MLSLVLLVSSSSGLVSEALPGAAIRQVHACPGGNSMSCEREQSSCLTARRGRSQRILVDVQIPVIA